MSISSSLPVLRGSKSLVTLQQKNLTNILLLDIQTPSKSDLSDIWAEWRPDLAWPTYLPTHLHIYISTYQPPKENTFKYQSQRLVTFEYWGDMTWLTDNRPMRTSIIDDQFTTIILTWQLRVPLDSTRNCCDAVDIGQLPSLCFTALWIIKAWGWQKNFKTLHSSQI